MSGRSRIPWEPMFQALFANLGIHKTPVTGSVVPRDPLKRVIVSLQDTSPDFAASHVAIAESLKKPASEAIPQHPILVAIEHNASPCELWYAAKLVPWASPAQCSEPTGAGSTCLP